MNSSENNKSISFEEGQSLGERTATAASPVKTKKPKKAVFYAEKTCTRLKRLLNDLNKDPNKSRLSKLLLETSYITETAAESVVAQIKSSQPVALEDTGLPVVYALAGALAGSCGEKLDETILRAYLTGANNVYPMGEEELCVFMPFFQLSLLDSLIDTAEEMNFKKADNIIGL